MIVRYDAHDINGRKYEHVDEQFENVKESKLGINLDKLHTLEVINYNSNMINE